MHKPTQAQQNIIRFIELHYQGSVRFDAHREQSPYDFIAQYKEGAETIRDLTPPENQPTQPTYKPAGSAADWGIPNY